MRVLAIHPNLEGRAEFQRAASDLVGLKLVQLADSLGGARTRLAEGHLYHALYVSDLYDMSVLEDFVLSCRKLEAGSESAYMLTVTDREHGLSGDDAVALGFDGFIREPLEPALLAGSLERSRKLFNERRQRRQIEALDLLISGALKSVDGAAGKIPFHQDINSDLETLNRIATAIRSLPKGTQAKYFARLLDTCTSDRATVNPRPNPLPEEKKVSEKTSFRIIRKR